MPTPPSPWLLLAFRLARDPSTPRIAVWRQLKRYGAVRLLDGLVALPLDDRNRERVEQVADSIVQAQGEVQIWIGELASAEQEQALVARMRGAVAGDYRRLIDEAEAVARLGDGPRRRSLARLRRELDRIGERDYFSTPERELARQAVDEVGASVAS
jgi:hypothetical protein